MRMKNLIFNVHNKSESFALVKSEIGRKRNRNLNYFLFWMFIEGKTIFPEVKTAYILRNIQVINQINCEREELRHNAAEARALGRKQQ